MPRLTVRGCEVELSRNLALLDTNVLVAAAHPGDQLHAEASVALEELDYEFLVLPAVVTEACGLLQSRVGVGAAQAMLAWLLTPGRGFRLLPDPNHPSELDSTLALHSAWMASHRVDYVDAYLMQVADTMTRCFDLRPHTPVCTFDTRDYLKCAAKGHLYSLYDMRDRYLIDFAR